MQSRRPGFTGQRCAQVVHPNLSAFEINKAGILPIRLLQIPRGGLNRGTHRQGRLAGAGDNFESQLNKTDQ